MLFNRLCVDFSNAMSNFLLHTHETTLRFYPLRKSTIIFLCFQFDSLHVCRILLDHLNHQPFDLQKRRLQPPFHFQFVVVSLKVIGLTVKKFLQPNLSLLVDAQPGGSIHDLGKLIYRKMQDRHWEIRDTALELLHICTDIAYISMWFLYVSLVY